MKLTGKKIGILIESDFYEEEIFYYKHRFAEEGIELHFLSRLWGQDSLTFKGHEYQASFTCHQTFEGMDDETLGHYSAIIVPAGMVADRLRYTEDIAELPPAAEFLQRAFANRAIIKGVICHAIWLLAPIAEVVKGRRLVTHNNCHWDAIHMGAIYTDQDLVIDDDLVTARTGGHCHLLAQAIIQMMYEKEG